MKPFNFMIILVGLLALSLLNFVECQDPAAPAPAPAPGTPAPGTPAPAPAPVPAPGTPAPATPGEIIPTAIGTVTSKCLFVNCYIIAQIRITLISNILFVVFRGT
jgi:hypothetical protein